MIIFRLRKITLYVQYNCDDIVLSNVFTKGMWLKSVRYLNARLVHNLYANSGGGSGIGEKISRVTAISAACTQPNDNNAYAAYCYKGAGRMVVEGFAQPNVRLDYWGQTPDTCAGLDRFGRVTQQLWRDYGAGDRSGAPVRPAGWACARVSAEK